MPELPEVQTTVDGINRLVKGLTVKDAWTSYKSVHHKGKDNIKDPKYFLHFKKEVVGQKITGAKRRAKNVIVTLSNGGVLLVHMKMTGHILYGDFRFDKKDPKDPWKGVSPVSLRDPFNKFIRFILTLSNSKYLALSDMRKFAKVTYIKESDLATTLHLEHIGPEPLEKSFGTKKFKERLQTRPDGKIKQVLMDQSVVAGIGNIYSDEILWRVGIHPERKVKDITGKEFSAMRKAMIATLKSGIDFGGDSMSDYRNISGERGHFQAHHNAYRRTGQKCKKPGCPGTIRRKIVGGRSAHFCDVHQR